MPELVVRALELVPSDSLESGHLLSHYGYQLGQARGDDQGAQEAFEQALAIAQREGDQVLEMWTLARAGNVGITFLRPQECLLKHGQAIDLNIRIGDPDVEVMARDCVVTTLMAMGDIEEANSQVQAMLSYAESRKAGYRPELAWSCCDYADMLLDPSTSSGRAEQGNRAKAITLLDESLAISSELGMRLLMERVLSRREILIA